MNLENKVTDFLPPHQKIRLFFHFIFTFPNGKPIFVLRQDFFTGGNRAQSVVTSKLPRYTLYI